MSTKTVDISDLSTKSRKYMVAATLEKRDKINKAARGVAHSALSNWQSTAPRKTGKLRNSVAFSANKSTAGVTTVSAQFHLVNILNNNKTRTRKTAGFYNRYKNDFGRIFYGKIKGL